MKRLWVGVVVFFLLGLAFAVARREGLVGPRPGVGQSPP